MTTEYSNNDCSSLKVSNMPRYLGINYLEEALQERRSFFARTFLTVPQHLEYVERYPHRGNLPDSLYRTPWHRVKPDISYLKEEARLFSDHIDELTCDVNISIIEKYDRFCVQSVSDPVDLDHFGTIPSSNPESLDSSISRADYALEGIERCLVQETEQFEKEILPCLDQLHTGETCLEEPTTCVSGTESLGCMPSISALLCRLQPQSVEDPFVQKDTNLQHSEHICQQYDIDGCNWKLSELFVESVLEEVCKHDFSNDDDCPEEFISILEQPTFIDIPKPDALLEYTEPVLQVTAELGHEDAFGNLFNSTDDAHKTYVEFPTFSPLEVTEPDFCIMNEDAKIDSCTEKLLLDSPVIVEDSNTASLQVKDLLADLKPSEMTAENQNMSLCHESTCDFFMKTIWKESKCIDVVATMHLPEPIINGSEGLPDYIDICETLVWLNMMVDSDLADAVLRLSWDILSKVSLSAVELSRIESYFISDAAPQLHLAYEATSVELFDKYFDVQFYDGVDDDVLHYPIQALKPKLVQPTCVSAIRPTSKRLIQGYGSHSSCTRCDGDKISVSETMNTAIGSLNDISPDYNLGLVPSQLKDVCNSDQIPNDDIDFASNKEMVLSSTGQHDLDKKLMIVMPQGRVQPTPHDNTEKVHHYFQDCCSSSNALDDFLVMRSQINKTSFVKALPESSDLNKRLPLIQPKGKLVESNLKSKCKKVPVKITDEYKRGLDIIDSYAQFIINSLLRQNQLPCDTQSLLSLTPDITRYLLREKQCTQQQDVLDDDVHHGLLTLHILCSAYDLSINCSFQAALCYLNLVMDKHKLQLKGSLMGLYKDLSDLQYHFHTNYICNPKLTAICNQITEWRNQKQLKNKEANPKVLLVISRELETLRDSIVAGLSTLIGLHVLSVPSGTHANSDYVIDKLDEYNCLVVYACQLNPQDFPWAHINLLVEYEHEEASEWQQVASQLDIRCFSYEIIRPKPQQETGISGEGKLDQSCSASKDETDQGVFISYGQLSSNKELLQLLETRHNVIILERNYMCVCQTFDLISFPDLDLAELSCAVLSQDTYLTEDWRLEPFILKLLMLSLKYTHCWIIIGLSTGKCNTSDKQRSFQHNLIKLQAALANLQSTMVDYEAHLVLCWSLEEIASVLSKLGRNLQASGSRTAELQAWMQLPEQLTQEEKFLLAIPCVNAMSCQSILKATSLHTLLASTQAELQTIFSYFPARIIQMFHDTLHSDAGLRLRFAPGSESNYSGIECKQQQNQQLNSALTNTAVWCKKNQRNTPLETYNNPGHEAADSVKIQHDKEKYSMQTLNEDTCRETLTESYRLNQQKLQASDMRQLISNDTGNSLTQSKESTSCLESYENDKPNQFVMAEFEGRFHSFNDANVEDSVRFPLSNITSSTTLGDRISNNSKSTLPVYEDKYDIDADLFTKDFDDSLSNVSAIQQAMLSNNLQNDPTFNSNKVVSSTQMLHRRGNNLVEVVNNHDLMNNEEQILPKSAVSEYSFSKISLPINGHCHSRAFATEACRKLMDTPSSTYNTHTFKEKEVHAYKNNHSNSSVVHPNTNLAQSVGSSSAKYQDMESLLFSSHHNNQAVVQEHTCLPQTIANHSETLPDAHQNMLLSVTLGYQQQQSPCNRLRRNSFSHSERLSSEENTEQLLSKTKTFYNANLPLSVDRIFQESFYRPSHGRCLTTVSNQETLASGLFQTNCSHISMLNYPEWYSVQKTASLSQMKNNTELYLPMKRHSMALESIPQSRHSLLPRSYPTRVHVGLAQPLLRDTHKETHLEPDSPPMDLDSDHELEHSLNNGRNKKERQHPHQGDRPQQLSNKWTVTSSNYQTGDVKRKRLTIERVAGAKGGQTRLKFK